MKQIELKPIKESTEDYEKMEARIKAAYKKLLYIPLLVELNLPSSTISNSTDAKSSLLHGLETGRITYSGASFKGRFDADSSKELKEMGATWSKGTWKLPKSELPAPLREAISIGEVRYQERIARIDKRLSQVDPAKIAEQIKTKDLFEKVVLKTDKEIRKSLKDHSFVPKLTKEQQAKIADEWQNNMDLWINNFTEEEIVRLRKDIAQSVLAGNRYESVSKTLQKSYGVTSNKAKFLARQEAGLLLAKFKEVRYTDSGVTEYKWKCVAGSKNHPVRESHKILDGKTFSWSNPPITTAPDEPQRRNNPGQDYNCRCMAIPIVKFK